MGLTIWGAFLLIVGAGLLVFSRPYAAWAQRFTPVPRGLSPRLLTALVGAAMFVAGAWALLASFGLINR